MVRAKSQQHDVVQTAESASQLVPAIPVSVAGGNNR